MESLKGDAAGVDWVEVTDSFVSVSAIAARASSAIWGAVVLHDRQVASETGLCQLRHYGVTEKLHRFLDLFVGQATATIKFEDALCHP